MEFRKSLARLATSLEENPNQDIEDIQEFILNAPQDELRNHYRQVSHLCHFLTETLIRTHRSVAGINLISNTIARIQYSKNQLTSIHADLCLLCLDAKCVNPALEFLDIDYSEIRKLDDKEDYARQVMLFYYYGGLIYAATKQFDKASFFFEVVLTIPANLINPVMQETFKKQMLMSLLITGRVPDNLLPRYISPCITMLRKSTPVPYMKLAQEYPSLNHDAIAKVVRNGANIFERDENSGLIGQCLTQVFRRKIKRLTKTFLTLALRDVAEHVGLQTEQQAEEYILNMIDDGEIFATINQKDGMVVFQDNPETYESVNVFKKLQEEMSVCTSLTEILKKLEIDTDVDKRFGL